jgi:transcriptional regulator with XRE-family HTH domain
MKMIAGEQTRENIGIVIKEKRVQMHITQDALSEEAKITRTYLNLIEHGKRIPSYAKLKAIADVLGESVVDLIVEAERGEVDPKIKLAYITAKLVEDGDSTKITKMLEFIEKLK